jgi:hypothetical protein
VWDGSCRAEAAAAAGMKDHSPRETLESPIKLKAFYRGQLDVLRTSELARNLQALARIRDQNRNLMAAVAAAKAKMLPVVPPWFLEGAPSNRLAKTVKNNLVIPAIYMVEPGGVEPPTS